MLLTWSGFEEMATKRTIATASKDRFYLPELDGLRFFAFLAVFLSHIAVFSNGASTSRPALVELFNMFGRFGVDLFFALSAYLLTSLMLAERKKCGTLDLRSFYMRRLLRIWPLYFTWLAALIVTRHVWSDYSVSFFVPFLLFAGNFAAAFGAVTSLVILPLWSLSVEEQFYIVWPLLFRKLTRRGVAVAGITVLIFSICIRFELLRAGMTPHQIWFLGFARIGAIALGILIAALPRYSNRARGLWFLLGIACWGDAALCHLYRMHPEGMAAPMWGFTLAAVGAAAFLFATIGIQRGTILTNPLCIQLGRISYGMYVFHGAALVLASRIVPASPDPVFWPVFALVGFGLTLMFSVASYRWIESPFLRMKKHYEVVRSAPLTPAMVRLAA
jgi:peptidoglycan/LPS O-acetylase OafA/YrhL